MLYSRVEGVWVEERRQHQRVGISFPVECTSLPSRKYFYTVTKDLSLGGARIISDAFLSKGEPFEVGVNLIDRVIDLEAKVAWCCQEKRQSRCSAGLEFKNINPGDQSQLSRFIRSIDNS